VTKNVLSSKHIRNKYHTAMVHERQTAIKLDAVDFAVFCSVVSQ